MLVLLTLADKTKSGRQIHIFTSLLLSYPEKNSDLYFNLRGTFSTFCDFFNCNAPMVRSLGWELNFLDTPILNNERQETQFHHLYIWQKSVSSPHMER